MEAYENLSLDYFYLGLIDKATFYSNKFKYGNFEGEDSVVRRAALSIIINRIEMLEKGHPREKFINGKFVKTNFERMPSPSSFGGGVAMKLKVAMQKKEDKA